MTHEPTMNRPSLTQIDDVTYLIASRTRPDTTHTVAADTGRCTCEAGRHDVECWHVDFVRAVHYWHRYEQRAARWPERAAQLAACAAGGMAALQEAYSAPFAPCGDRDEIRSAPSPPAPLP